MTIHKSAFIHSEAVVLGDVSLGEKASVWPTAVIRGDSAAISVGNESNVQDGAVLHADENMPCVIGDRVTIGHRAIVHGATVEDDCLIGMGAIVLNKAVIGRGSLIGAGALVTEGTVIPPRSLVLGVPGRRIAEVDDDTTARMTHGCQAYVELSGRHQRGDFSRR